jgi:hypothetical protein
MPKRSSPRDIQDLADLSRLGDLVVDKRVGKRAVAKQNRRNRHYENQFVRNTVARAGSEPRIDADEPEPTNHELTLTKPTNPSAVAQTRPRLSRRK